MDQKNKEIENIDYEQEARDLEDRLRTAIKGGEGEDGGDGGGSW